LAAASDYAQRNRWHMLLMHFNQCLVEQLGMTHAERQSPQCLRFTVHRRVERPIVTLQHAVPLATLSASKPLLAHDHVGRNRDETPDEHAQDCSGDNLRASRSQACLCCLSSAGGLPYTLCCLHVELSLCAPQCSSCYTQRLSIRLWIMLACSWNMQRSHPHSPHVRVHIGSSSLSSSLRHPMRRRQAARAPAAACDPAPPSCAAR